MNCRHQSSIFFSVVHAGAFDLNPPADEAGCQCHMRQRSVHEHMKAAAVSGTKDGKEEKKIGFWLLYKSQSDQIDQNL
uniref:Uncharacterized protein n=1 Tax=Oryza sativa subsp. japonica TaxID=39947 RepID=Q6ESZ3_ORYSJ|nr:hypothetical protein [Oryza sativa Japonica Group]BAD28227.1 hypothetical protein [Oryza sativa Japonica Group]